MATERKKAGRIAPVLMGDYDDTTTYRRLDWVYYGGTSYICKKNNTVGIVPSNTERWQKIVDEVKDMHITFSEMSERILFTSGESLSTIIGKIKKYLSDLTKVAFTGKYTDLSDTPISLKNPNALNIKFNGVSQVSYDGSIAKEVNVTPADIGAVNTSTLLNTTEQISANTDANNITGALAAKAIMTDYNNKFTQLNSNLPDFSWGTATINDNIASDASAQWQKYGNICTLFFVGYISLSSAWEHYQILSNIPKVKYAYTPFGIFQQQDSGLAYVVIATQEGTLDIRADSHPVEGWFRGTITYICQ